MAYDKRTWKIGEEITADKLNHMEDGIAAGGSGGGSGMMVVHEVYDESTDKRRLDKTWREIYDNVPNVAIIVNEETLDEDTENNKKVYFIIAVDQDTINNNFSVNAVDGKKALGANTVNWSFKEYLASTPEDYPTSSEE